jgi:hypothetical protein
VDGINTYNWNPIPDLKNETCLVRVSDARSEFSSEVRDTSDAVFKIRPQINLTQPVANQNVTAHSSTTPIHWTYTGSRINYVNIEYSTTGGGGPGNWTSIQDNVDVTQNSTYIWPLVPTTTCNNILIFFSNSSSMRTTAIYPSQRFAYVSRIPCYTHFVTLSYFL